MLNKSPHSKVLNRKRVGNFPLTSLRLQVNPEKDTMSDGTRIRENKINDTNAYSHMKINKQGVLIRSMEWGVRKKSIN